MGPPVGRVGRRGQSAVNGALRLVSHLRFVLCVGLVSGRSSSFARPSASVPSGACRCAKVEGKYINRGDTKRAGPRSANMLTMIAK